MLLLKLSEEADFEKALEDLHFIMLLLKLILTIVSPAFGAEFTFHYASIKTV